MIRNQLEFFLICSVIIYVCSGRSNATTKTLYLFMDCVTYMHNPSIVYIWNDFIHIGNALGL